VRFLFIGGAARSGTTAFVRLLNRHPAIALGIERYKFVYGKRPEHVGPHLFDSDRFFAFNNEETNILGTFLGPIEDFKVKFENAAYRGDKIPSVMRYRNNLIKKLPGCKFIILYRDIYRVCSSWNQRAQDPNDRWGAHQDFTAAVKAVNRELSSAVDLRQRQPARCLIVRYENIFGPNALSTMSTIVGWLKVGPHPRFMKAVELNREEAMRLREKPLLEHEGQREFIKKHIDWAVTEKAEALAV